MSDKKPNSARAGRKTAVAIAALLSCGTIEQASQVVGIPASTLRRWRTQPEFSTQLCRAQEEILAGVVNELRTAGTSAATTLRDICTDTEAADGARVRAATTIITLLMRAHELETIETRLTILESRRRDHRGSRN